MTIYGFSIWFILSVIFAAGLTVLVGWLLSVVYRQTQAEKNMLKRAAPVMDKNKKTEKEKEEVRIADEKPHEESINTRFFGEEDDIFANSPFRTGESPLFGVQPTNEIVEEESIPQKSPFGSPAEDTNSSHELWGDNSWDESIPTDTHEETDLFDEGEEKLPRPSRHPSRRSLRNNLRNI